ncbi:hypothetical protein A8B98_18665 [Hymenobacter sp. UV11]|nr:hypothetical protein A8B98_18665 [Hymenobacter sp. UV11]
MLLLALAGCQAKQPAIQGGAEAAARRDSVHAARLDSSAHHLYTAAQAAEDSATFYRLQSHAQITPTLDTATLRRFFADYAR